MMESILCNAAVPSRRYVFWEFSGIYKTVEQFLTTPFEFLNIFYIVY